MTGFWIFAALLTGASLVAMLWPLLRTREQPTGDRAAFDITVYRDQLREVERDLELSLIDAEQAEAARVEIQRRILSAEVEDKDIDAPPTHFSHLTNLVMVGVIAVLVAGGAISLYLKLGAPGQPDLPLASRDLRSEAASQQQTDIDQMVGQLAARLEKNPDDARGWALLGRSYEAMERWNDAALAYAKAADLADRPPQLLGAYVEALIMAGGGETIPPEVVPALEELQAKDPTDPRSYFYIGAFKAVRGDELGALQEWINLEAVSPADAPWMGELEERIHLAREAIGPAADDLRPMIEIPVDQGEVDQPPPFDPEIIRIEAEGLAARLENDPDDLDGWRRLGDLYEALGQNAKAAEARMRAMR